MHKKIMTIFHLSQLLQTAKVVQGAESADPACDSDEAILVKVYDMILKNLSSVFSIGVRSQGIATPLNGFNDIQRGV